MTLECNTIGAEIPPPPVIRSSSRTHSRPYRKPPTNDVDNDRERIGSASPKPITKAKLYSAAPTVGDKDVRRRSFQSICPSERFSKMNVVQRRQSQARPTFFRRTTDIVTTSDAIVTHTCSEAPKLTGAAPVRSGAGFAMPTAMRNIDFSFLEGRKKSSPKATTPRGTKKVLRTPRSTASKSPNVSVKRTLSPPREIPNKSPIPIVRSKSPNLSVRRTASPPREVTLKSSPGGDMRSRSPVRNTAALRSRSPPAAIISLMKDLAPLFEVVDSVQNDSSKPNPIPKSPTTTKAKVRSNTPPARWHGRLAWASASTLARNMQVQSSRTSKHVAGTRCLLAGRT